MKFDNETIQKYIGYSAKDLTDNGICPTCFNRATNGSVFGNDANKIVYQDQDIICMFVSNPRANGHMIIVTTEHYQDFVDCPDKINKKIICYAKQLAIIIKQVFKCEKVYLCTMCDGPMNHYHMQLIPRYSYEERGSKNFVKPRKEFVYDETKFNLVKEKITKIIF